MPTLEELCKQYDIDLNEGQEKTASAHSTPDASAITEELGSVDVNTEKNSDGGNNMSLSDLYNEAFTEEQVVEETEMDKVAEAELEKVASDYIAAGRFMARGFYDEITKIASAPSQEKEDAEVEAQLHAVGAAKTEVSDKSGLKVNTSEARDTYKDVLKEKYINAMLNKKNGVNVSGSTGEDHKVAPDAAK